MADLSGMDIRRVRALIHGQGNPTNPTLVKLCRGLKVRPGELMNLADKYRRKGWKSRPVRRAAPPQPSKQESSNSATRIASATTTQATTMAASTAAATPL